jgi:hypothetical protein
MRYLDCGCAIRDDGTRAFCPTCENPPPASSACRWTQDEDGVWFSSCGEAHVFTGGNPEENKYLFCPYCGRNVEWTDEIMGAIENDGGSNASLSTGLNGSSRSVNWCIGCGHHNAPKSAICTLCGRSLE